MLCEAGSCKYSTNECIPTGLANCNECIYIETECTKCAENYYLEIEAICSAVCSIGTCGQTNFECIRTSITDC